MTGSSFTYERRVEFAETDMAGILHFANYFRYMEECEHAFFRSLGLSIHAATEDGFRGFARGECSCRYERPLRYEDVALLHLRVTEKRTKSLHYEITFEHCGHIVARGKVTAIHVGASEGGTIRAIPLPPEVDSLVVVAPEQGAQNAR
ncbi:MAG: acyl-CoA thioesterase [Planctomycetes bacterium]|nr:acyl-CoA thioesterase [Planctomycetota bacterium]MCB9890481.1 acyl-CoA thioesterase [Planctomycetota bacterium]MCB9917722.1 acyl-CoA thioesterase [Planctomycetota bacterium]